MSEKKTEVINAYLIKNSKGVEKRRKKEEEKGGGGGGGSGWRHSQKQSEGLGGVFWVYKIGLK